MLENSKKKIIRLNLLLKQLLVDIIFLVGHDHGDLCGNTNYVRLNTVYFMMSEQILQHDSCFLLNLLQVLLKKFNVHTW